MNKQTISRRVRINLSLYKIHALILTILHVISLNRCFDFVFKISMLLLVHKYVDNFNKEDNKIPNYVNRVMTCAFNR